MSDEDRLRYPEDPDEGEMHDRWDGYLAPRVWFPVGLLGLAAVAILGVMLALNWGGSDGSATPQNPQPGDTLRQGVHWHADFALIVRGEAYDFTGDEFLSTEDGELSSAVHIHEPRHDVVHVHLSNSTWGEFFESLGFRIGDSCVDFPDGERICDTDDEQWTFLVNGVAIDTLRFQYIGDLDRVVLSYGPESADEVRDGWESLVGDQACIPSAVCSDRFPPGGIEDEPCAVGSTTCN